MSQIATVYADTAVVLRQQPAVSLLPLPVQADDLSKGGRRALAAGVLALHVLGAWAVWHAMPVQPPVPRVATLMVSMIALPEQITPEPPKAQPQPAPQSRPTPAPVIAAAPSPAPAQHNFVAPEPEPVPPAPVAVAPAPAPVVTPAPVAPPQPPAPKKIPPSAVRYQKLPVLNFPLLSKRAHESGIVVLRIVVDASGRLKDASVHKSSGFARLDEQAIQDIRSARFAPQTEDGKPVEWETLAPLAYELDR